MRNQFFTLITAITDRIIGLTLRAFDFVVRLTDYLTANITFAINIL